MLLGRRKSGFTEEVTLRPDEIPDYVNEENDTTFRRPKSSCLGDMQQEANEPQEWTPPPPMPMHMLLREFIRSQCEAAIITPRKPLIEEDPDAEALLDQIQHDPACADIVTVEGQKDVYYYSSEKMSRFVAWITALVIEDDLAYLIAEFTRHNCVTYPAPTLIDYFTLTPFRYDRARIDATLDAMEKDERYQDIRRFRSAKGREYIYSSAKMTERYAFVLSNDMDRGPVD